MKTIIVTIIGMALNFSAHAGSISLEAKKMHSKMNALNCGTLLVNDALLQMGFKVGKVRTYAISATGTGIAAPSDIKTDVSEFWSHAKANSLGPQRLNAEGTDLIFVNFNADTFREDGKVITVVGSAEARITNHYSTVLNVETSEVEKAYAGTDCVITQDKQDFSFDHTFDLVIGILKWPDSLLEIYYPLVK